MHLGVRKLIDWVRTRDGKGEIIALPPARKKILERLEHTIGTPLPADLRMLLGFFDGALLPSGNLLRAGEADGPGMSIGAALTSIAEKMRTSILDPEIMLPFHRSDEGRFLAFDRSAAPVADTWPVVDYDPRSGETSLVHRTFDGWCELSVLNWCAPEYARPFSVDRYLAEGSRHVSVEPDVSVAHVTVAHALRRAGEPEKALCSYLEAGRCVPSVPWADWEALKVAALLGDRYAALEAAMRLGKNAPPKKWLERDTEPARVIHVLGWIVSQGIVEPAAQEQWLRVLDQLLLQTQGDKGHQAAVAIRHALANHLPLPVFPNDPLMVGSLEIEIDDELELPDEMERWWGLAVKSYGRGQLKEEELLFDPRFVELSTHHDLADLLRIRREF